MNNRLISI